MKDVWIKDVVEEVSQHVVMIVNVHVPPSLAKDYLYLHGNHPYPSDPASMPKWKIEALQMQEQKKALLYMKTCPSIY